MTVVMINILNLRSYQCL